MESSGQAINSYVRHVEIISRILAIVLGSIPALISAAAFAGEWQSETPVQLLTVPPLAACVGLVIAMSVLGAVLQGTMIIMRFTKCVTSGNIKKIFGSTAICGIILALGFLAGGIINAYYSAFAVPSLASSAVFSFIAVLLYGFVAAWELCHVFGRFNIYNQLD